ncbi:MAG TPA: hypothetical protein P5110_06415 [Candidatus Omnitrophota bacterium]|nr:hypothetical protein [Candidatus Omnitrophota bacterium]HRZ15125.1 hypothetical protein [Candidatus Omnitrophota bacterium]
MRKDLWVRAAYYAFIVALYAILARFFFTKLWPTIAAWADKFQINRIWINGSEWLIASLFLFMAVDFAYVRTRSERLRGPYILLIAMALLLGPVRPSSPANSFWIHLLFAPVTAAALLYLVNKAQRPAVEKTYRIAGICLWLVVIALSLFIEYAWSKPLITTPYWELMSIALIRIFFNAKRLFMPAREQVCGSSSVVEQ